MSASDIVAGRRFEAAGIGKVYEIVARYRKAGVGEVATVKLLGPRPGTFGSVSEIEVGRLAKCFVREVV